MRKVAGWKLSSVLNFNEEVLPLKSLLIGGQTNKFGNGAHTEYAVFAHASINRSTYRDVTEIEPNSSKRHLLLLGSAIVGLHLVVFWAYLHSSSTHYIPPQKREVLVTFAKPEVIPPPVVEPLPPPPKVQQPPPSKPTPALRTPPAEQNISANDITVPENTEASKSTGPAEAAPPTLTEPAAAPVPPKVEPLVEAFGGIGYLNNPAPEYPGAAERQGWGGKAQLRVHVLPDGTAGAIEVKKSTGHKVLDDAAIKAVKGWRFSPAKRGNQSVEGVVNVSLDFQPSS